MGSSYGIRSITIRGHGPNGVCGVVRFRQDTAMMSVVFETEPLPPAAHERAALLRGVHINLMTTKKSGSIIMTGTNVEEDVVRPAFEIYTNTVPWFAPHLLHAESRIFSLFGIRKIPRNQEEIVEAFVFALYRGAVFIMSGILLKEDWEY